MDKFLEGIKIFFDWLITGFSNIIVEIGMVLQDSTIGIMGIYTFSVRWWCPILAILIFFRCILPLLHDKGYDVVWANLAIPNGHSIPLKHWKNSIGRSKLSDIVINFPFISRSHGVLSYDGNNWTITDLASKGGIKVNGERITKTGRVEEGDTISFANAEFLLLAPESGHENIPTIGYLKWFSGFGKDFISRKTLFMIIAFQILGGIQIAFSAKDEMKLTILFTILIFTVAECFYFFAISKFSKKYSELELMAFFLSGLSLLIIGSAAPQLLLKQLIAITTGIAVYFVIQLIVKDLSRANKLKYILIAGAIILLVLNLVIGEARFGAKNWINLGFITFQPMEFVKIAFVLAGTATLDKLLTARNLTAFIGFSAACIIVLVLISDLGTAAVFFGAFLVISFMRSGDLRTIAFIASGAALGAMAIIMLMPYIALRFKAWRHVWEFADTIGYQQTRTMIASASGGLMGVGGGNGYLVNVAASDTDLVFGILCEEWGLIIALIAVLMLVFFAFSTIFITNRCKSSFYAIAACGVASIFLSQTALNVFGSVDLLPLTGITLPFISNGGSSMVASWGLLAFIKAADERYRPEIVNNNEVNG